MTKVWVMPFATGLFVKAWEYSSLIGVIMLWALAVQSVEGSDGRAGEEVHSSSWQDCEIFLAPSSLPTGGWGVYSGRSFRRNEIVEIAPRFLSAPYDAAVIKTSVLDDYIYGYIRYLPDSATLQQLAAVVFGNIMFYNHHPTPNVGWISFGREPNRNEQGISQATGFVAKREIEPGEELFSTYGAQDQGVIWFKDRGLEMKEVPAYLSRKNGTTYQMDKQKYCSKIHAGAGKPNWDRVMESTKIANGAWPYKFSADRLAPDDHATAVVKYGVVAGDVLEMSPVLILSKEKVRNTLLAPLSIFWNDWNDEQRSKLRDLKASGDLIVQHQSSHTSWKRSDWFENFDDVVLFPVAGSIGMVEKVGHLGDFNCVLRLVSSGSMKSYENHGGTDGSAGIILELVATRDLKIGDKLRLQVEFNASPLEKKLLATELNLSGQPIPGYLVRFLETVKEEL